MNSLIWLTRYFGGVLSADDRPSSPFSWSPWAGTQWQAVLETCKAKVIWERSELPRMNAVTFFLDQYFYLHIKRRLFLPFPCSRAEKVPYQARVCVKDSFVKCWQQPQQAVPSQSSPPRRPGAQQGSPAWPGLGWALLAGLGHSGDGTLGTLGTAPSFAPGTPCWSRACSLCSPHPGNCLPKSRGAPCVCRSQHPQTALTT